MKNKFLSFVVGIAIAFSSVLSAQGAESQPTQAAAVQPKQELAAPADAIEVTEVESVNNELNEVRTLVGLDADKYFTSIKVQKIGKKSSDKDYILAIQEAYRAAWEDAIVEIVESIQNELSQAVENGLLSDTNGLKKGDLDPKLAALINQELKRQLQEQNVDLTDEAAVKAALPKIAEAQSTKSAIKMASQLYIAGIIAERSIVKNGEVGVLAYYSPAMKKLADCLVTKRPFTKLPARERVALQVRKIKPKELVCTLGTRLYVDENGKACIVSFAIERIVSNSSIASQSADRNARGMIADFVGTAVAVASEKESARDIGTLEDSMGNTTDKASVSSKLQSLGKRGTEKMKFEGVKAVLNKELKLSTGQRVLVRAVIWSPVLASLAAEAVQGSQESQALREQSANGANGVAAPGAPASKPAVKPVTPKTPEKNQELQGTGAAGLVL